MLPPFFFHSADADAAHLSIRQQYQDTSMFLSIHSPGFAFPTQHPEKLLRFEIERKDKLLIVEDVERWIAIGEIDASDVELGPVA